MAESTSYDPVKGHCGAVANLQGAHVPCDGGYDHRGLAHSNREFELLWMCEVEVKRDGR